MSCSQTNVVESQSSQPTFDNALDTESIGGLEQLVHIGLIVCFLLTYTLEHPLWFSRMVYARTIEERAQALADRLVEERVVGGAAAAGSQPAVGGDARTSLLADSGLERDAINLNIRGDSGISLGVGLEASGNVVGGSSGDVLKKGGSVASPSAASTVATSTSVGVGQSVGGSDVGGVIPEDGAGRRRASAALVEYLKHFVPLPASALDTVHPKRRHLYFAVVE